MAQVVSFVRLRVIGELGKGYRAENECQDWIGKIFQNNVLSSARFSSRASFSHALIAAFCDRCSEMKRSLPYIATKRTGDEGP